MCVLEELYQVYLSLTLQKKVLQNKEVKLTLSAIFHTLWKILGFLSALNIFHFSTEKFLPTIFVPQSHTIPISNCHSLGYNQYSCILPSILYQRAATAPTFQWELPNMFSHSFISSRIFSAEIIDARQPMPA